MVEVALEGGEDPNEDASRFLLPFELTSHKVRISMKGFCHHIDRQNVNMHILDRNLKTILALMFGQMNAMKALIDIQNKKLT
jgi:hypothetical protein